MATDNQALLLQVSADVRGLQKQMERANGIVDAGAKSWERSAKRGASAVENALGGIRLPPRLAKEFNQLGADIGRGFQTTSRAAQLALGAISIYAIKLASDAGEIESAFDVAFKGAAESAREFSDVLSKRVGRDAVETREAMTRLQLVLTGTGVAAEQAAEMTKRLAEVGIDAGSLFNTSDAEAFQKIISGLSGEAEPLKAFGVVITETATKAELLRLGFKGNAQEASEAAKSIARANLIMKGLAVAQGDATRTAGSAANQTRALRAEFNAAARDLGQQLLPGFVKVTKGAADMLKAFNDLPGGVQVAGLAVLAFIAASGPIAGLLANLARVIKLAKETRAAIIAIGTANAAAGAGTGAGAAAAGAGAAAGKIGAGAAAGIAGGAAAAAGTAGFGVFEIVRGAKYQKTVKAAADATDAALASALESAKSQIKAASSGGPAGKAVVARLTKDLNTLAAEQARRATLAAVPTAPGAKPGADPVAAVVSGFTLPDALKTGTGGGKGSGKGKSAADKAARDAERQASETLRQQERADGLIARASEDLASARSGQAQTADERYQAELAAIDLDRATRADELAYSVKQKELTQAQADQVTNAEEAVRLQREITAGKARDAAKAEDSYNLRQAELDGQAEALQLQESLARTAKQRREIEYQLLDLAEQRAQADIDVIAATKGTASAEYQIAKKRLEDLQNSRGDRQAVVDQGTQGPLQDYFSRLPGTIDEVNEAFQNMEAQGIDSLINGLAEAANGSRKLGDVFRQTIQQMAADATRILLQSLISQGAQSNTGNDILKFLKIGASVAGGGSGGQFIGADGGFIPYASGGSVSGPGTGTSDSVPAMLSDGEFVVNAKSAAKHRKLLEQINGGNMPHMFLGGLFKMGALGFLGKHIGFGGLLPAAAGLKIGESHKNHGETVDLPRGATVIPSDLWKNMAKGQFMGAAGGDSSSTIFNVTVNGALSSADARRTGNQIAAQAQSRMAIAKRRGY